MSLLSIRNLSVHRNDQPVIEAVTLDIHAGEFVGLLGPNGAGKTTLLRAALGLIPHQGSSSLSGLSAPQRARKAAFMPQGRDIAWPISVEHLVALGGAAGAGFKRRKPAVDDAINALDLQPFRNRPATELSGGEQARVLIARMLAQETPLLVADEPVAGLDPAAQIKVARTFSDLAKSGRAVVASLHDLGLAARHCTRLIIMADGRIKADGPPATVLTPQNLARIFNISAHLAITPDGLVFQPLDILGKDAS